MFLAIKGTNECNLVEFVLFVRTITTIVARDGSGIIVNNNNNNQSSDRSSRSSKLKIIFAEAAAFEIFGFEYSKLVRILS